MESVISLVLLTVNSMPRDRGKTQVKTLDIPFSSSTETQLSEEAESLDSSSADEKATDQLEIPVGKAGVPSLLLHREGYTASYNIDTKTPNLGGMAFDRQSYWRESKAQWYYFSCR